MKDILKSEIYIMLMNKSKAEINDYRKLLFCDVKSNLNKSDMAAGVAQYIEEEAEYWLRAIPTWELEIVEHLIEMKPGDKFDGGHQPIDSVLETLDLWQTELNKTNMHVMYSLTPTMHRAMKAGFKNAMAYIMVRDYALLDQYVFGVLNTYGLIPKQVLDSYVLQASKQIQKELGMDDPDGLPGYFYAEESLLVNYFTVKSKEGMVFVYHPGLEPSIEFFNILLSCPESIKYKKFSFEEFMAAGIGYPFITTAMETLEGDCLMRCFEKFGKVRSYADFMFSDTFIMLQREDEELISLLDLSFKEAPHISPEDLEDFRYSIQAYKEVMPRWDLRGNSISEIQGTPRKTQKVKAINPLDYTAKKVEPNKPCPCGSGKKYKDCHGRLS